MNRARIIVLVIALAAGGLAALLASSGEKGPEPEAPVQIETVEVLIAKGDVPTGRALTADDMKWQIWPKEAAAPQYIRKSDRPEALTEFTGAIARSAFIAGEPLRDAKLIRGSRSGFLAAMLPAGMRAVSTEIAAESGAGGFILPNDRVDVLLTRRDLAAEQQAGHQVFVSETVLRNVQVLAIDQLVEEKDGQKVVVGKTATLELNARQAEQLALARQTGTVSLALRSLIDAKEREGGGNDKDGARSRINTVRFGVTTTSNTAK